MIDYLIVIQPLESSLTDAQIAQQLSTLTRGSIPIAELENFLLFEQLAWRNEITATWQGPLIDEINTNANGLAAGLTELFRHINKTRSTRISTNEQEWADQAALLMGGLLQTGLITQDQYNSIYGLAGGKLYGDVTEADIAASREAHAEQERLRAEEEERLRQEAIARQEEMEAERLRFEQFQKLQNDFTTSYNVNIAPLVDEQNTDSAAWQAAIQNMAANWGV